MRGESACPILGRIPIIGELFKTRSRKRDKTNLMVFIRPKILRDGVHDAHRNQREVQLHPRRADARPARSKGEILPLLPFNKDPRAAAAAADRPAMPAAAARQTPTGPDGADKPPSGPADGRSAGSRRRRTP